MSGWQSKPLPWDGLDLDFAVVKATEGRTHRSRGWRLHARDIASAGMVLGAYHFMHLDAPVDVQAAHFLDVVTLSGPTPAFAALDVEWSRKHDPKAKPRLRVKRIIEWCRTVRDSLGVPVMVYTQASYYRGRLASHPDLRRWPLWQAGRHALPGWEPTLVQRVGRLEGVEGRLDIDTATADLWPLPEETTT